MKKKTLKLNPRTPKRDHKNIARPSRKRASRFDIPENLQKDGVQRYWAIEGSERQGEIAFMEEEGWVFVTDDDGNRIKRAAGRGETHYLMEIKQEWYDEFMEEEQQRNIDTSQANIQALGQDEYVPKGQTSVVEKEREII